MKTLIALLFCLILPLTALADIDLNYSWTAPTVGSPVVEYLVQGTQADGTWANLASVTATGTTVTVADGVQAFQLRVAGVDALGRIGPWSAASDAFTDNGPPGQPGLPELLGTILAALALILVFFLWRRDE